MPYFLTLDVGTTSLKACLFSEALELQAVAQVEYALESSGATAECDPEVYWHSLVQGIGKILPAAGPDPEILAISITTQGETLIALSDRQQTLGKAIVWLDGRAEQEAAALRQILPPDRYYRATGMTGIWGTTPLAKLCWLRNHRPEDYARTRRYLLLSDYLVWRLTGVEATEATMMASTGYYHIYERRIWTEALELAGVDPAKIPPVKNSGDISGFLQPEAARVLGLSAGIPVLIAGNDQICGQVGSGNLSPGLLTETTGTALTTVAVLARDSIPPQPLFDVCLHANGSYLVLQYTQTAAILLKWFKDNFCTEEQSRAKALGCSVYDLLGDLAQTVPPGSDGLLLYPHFEGKNAPDPVPEARGAAVGLTLGMGKAHFVRAIMESIAYMLRENVEHLRRQGIVIDRIRSLGGGSGSPIWQQIKADVLGLELETLQCPEAASLGCAIGAAVTLGLFPDLEAACGQAVRIKNHTAPDPGCPDYDPFYRSYLRMDDHLRRFYQTERQEKGSE